MLELLDTDRGPPGHKDLSKVARAEVPVLVHPVLLEPQLDAMAMSSRFRTGSRSIQVTRCKL
jgi:hypothetical protein